MVIPAQSPGIHRETTGMPLQHWDHNSRDKHGPGHKDDRIHTSSKRVKYGTLWEIGQFLQKHDGVIPRKTNMLAHQHMNDTVCSNWQVV